MIKESMEIGAQHLIIFRDSAISAAIIQRYCWALQCLSQGRATVNFVTFDIATSQTQSPPHLAQLLVLFKISGHFQEPKTSRDTRGILHAMEIRYLRAEHLITATDTDYLAAVTQMTINRLIPAIVAQPL